MAANVNLFNFRKSLIRGGPPRQEGGSSGFAILLPTPSRASQHIDAEKPKPTPSKEKGGALLAPDNAEPAEAHLTLGEYIEESYHTKVPRWQATLGPIPNSFQATRNGSGWVVRRYSKEAEPKSTRVNLEAPTSQERIAHFLETREQRARRADEARLARANRVQAFDTTAEQQTASSSVEVSHSGKVSLRPACSGDFESVRTIYSDWADNAFVPVNPNALPSISYVQQTLQLPWIVAYRHDEMTTEQQIIGFAFAKNFGRYEDAYQHSVILELFVHNEHVEVGVGKALLDRLLSLLDKDHKVSASHSWQKYDENNNEYTVARKVDQIIIKLPYKTLDTDIVVWLTYWFGKYGFNKVGTMLNVAMRHNHLISETIFQKTTGSGIPPK
ncbi:MAG: hypothetical protein M1814_001406 [Vezdaea aestivalis]|nr:MAG: hypothetical protein M1814_001406 [Vezdaea aestivalis]